MIEEHSANKQSELAPDQFGYMSDHLITRIGSRGAWPEWANYAEIPVEFQVRTTLQHAWAAVNHKLSYKRVEEVPTALQRRLFRLSALFEMADEQFSAIRKAAAELSDEYSDNVKQGNLDIEIDADSVDAYIQNSAKVRGIMAAAVKRGFVLSPVDGPGVEQPRSSLLRLLDFLQVRTIGQFDALLPEVAEAAEALAMRKQVHREICPELHLRSDAAEHEILIILLLLYYDVPQSLFSTIYNAGWEFFLETRTRSRNRQ
ncbi:hypothetical protein [Lentzea nigeriaca]|uniref:hypothetical protein n=1 Tax=Lentzea nigeriaca TaxID=1128665 RepID=UPI00195A67DA|nr:hypothetical protein [Lentzea nigeriaca]MBM7859466.1 hypothetical protein [Lentzea nigeriaca]